MADGNTYEFITHTGCGLLNDTNSYGPYAYKIVSAEGIDKLVESVELNSNPGSPTIMDTFDLFRGLSDGSEFYFATDMVSVFPISIYNNIVSPISHIEVLCVCLSLL